MKEVFIKKIIRKVIVVILLLLVAFIYYYLTLPAINIHSAGFWFFFMFMIFVLNGMWLFKKKRKEFAGFSKDGIQLDMQMFKDIKFGILLLVIVFAMYIIGSILSSPIINAKKYQRLMTIEKRVFTEDVQEVDFSTIPLLDKDSASLLGNRKMGSIVEMVSQFEVDDDYTQINYNDKPVRVTPLKYASTIKWITNQKEGIPAYILIDMTNQNTSCINLTEGIKFSKSEHFNRNLYRHLRFNYPTYIFDDQIFFEIDDAGIPYWVCPVKKFNIGLFGGQTVGRVVLCNAVTGECTDYAINDVPQWIDKVYSAELLTKLYDYSGSLVNGYLNSILGQKGCLKTTNGYNYIALEDDVWVYTGVTSVSGDQSVIGFVLMNQRTMETRFYTIEGAIEDSAMSSAEGQVQHLGYDATFPLLLNIANEPTYFMALKDEAGLVKKYAMVNVQKYQVVATGDTVKECEKEYTTLLNTSGIVLNVIGENKNVKGEITALASVVIEGSTHIYLCIGEGGNIYDVDLLNQELISIIKYKIGDKVSIHYLDDIGLKPVVSIE